MELVIIEFNYFKWFLVIIFATQITLINIGFYSWPAMVKT